MRGLTGADVVDGLFWSSIRDVRGHRDEIFHGWGLRAVQVFRM
jgi:hypothetical protein